MEQNCILNFFFNPVLHSSLKINVNKTALETENICRLDVTSTLQYTIYMWMSVPSESVLLFGTEPKLNTFKLKETKKKNILLLYNSVHYTYFNKCLPCMPYLESVYKSHGQGN